MGGLFVDNDSVIEVGDLTDNDGNTLTAATVQATLFESDEVTEVGGQTWPLTLNLSSGSTYQATLDKSVEVTLGNLYLLKITAAEAGLEATWLRWYRAQRRAFDQ